MMIYQSFEVLGSIWTWLMDHLLYINLFFSIVIVFFQRKDPKAVWTWLMALYFVPVFGFLFYLVLEQDIHKSKMFRVKEVEDRFHYPAKKQEELLKQYDFALTNPMAESYGDLVVYNLETGGAVLTMRNEIDLFNDGKEKFRDLIRTIEKARSHIHIQYYIIKNDHLFDEIIEVLKKKVAEGVEVRVLYDGMGGRFMPKTKWQELEAAGVKVGVFFPAILGRLNLRINYRNHRKIVVIDGKIGYVGGFNIGKEYLGEDPKFGYWRDTHLKIYGDAVISLQIRFALDWNYATKENLFKQGCYFEPAIPLTENGILPMEFDKGLGIQIITSGPDQSTRQIRNNYLELFHKAKHHIYIQTPYFVPDDAILSALQIAARSGVDVKLMIPCKPDHPFVYWATYSYVGDLLESGVNCYTYEDGFLHSKGITIDSEVSCYGTANMDIRSFELNFEVNAVVYDRKTTEQLEWDFLEDLHRCKKITPEVYASRSLIVRIKEQFSRLLSPLL